MNNPRIDPCNCIPGYMCPNCEQEEKRKTRDEAEKHRVEKILDARNEQ